jgi:hypothetical protein
MNTPACIAGLAIILAGTARAFDVPTTVPNPPPVDRGTVVSPELRAAMTNLVLTGANRIARSNPLRPGSLTALDTEVILLDPFVVYGNKLWDFTPVAKETELDRFIRTKTIVEHVGTKVTTSVSIHGESDGAGFAKPTFEFQLSW